MNLPSVILLAIVLICFVLALRHILRRKGGCGCGGGCRGSCAQCTHPCNHRK